MPETFYVTFFAINKMQKTVFKVTSKLASVSVASNFDPHGTTFNFSELLLLEAKACL